MFKSIEGKKKNMGFSKILENQFDKDYLSSFLEEFNISKTGKITDLVNRILKNPSVLEYAIKDLLSSSYKEQLIGIVEDLGLDTDGNVSELKQKIIEEFEKETKDDSLQNKIKVIDACLDKDDIIEIMQEFNRPKAGKKLKLVEVIAKNQSMLEYAIKLGVRDAYKDENEELCEKLGIDSEGNKKILESRINDYLSRKEKTFNTDKGISDNVEKNIINQNNTRIDDTKENITFKIKKEHFKKYDSTFLKIIDTIQNEFKPEPCTDEKELQGQLTTFLNAKYPVKEIDREVNEDGAKLDIVIDKKYAIELKIARTPTTLRNLTAQLEEYQEVYPQIAALLLNIIENSNIESIKEYAKKYDEKLNIPTIIVEGRMRRSRGTPKHVKVEIEDYE